MIDYEFLKNNIKFTNKSNKDLKLKLTGILVGTNITSDLYIEYNINKQTWFVPNFNYNGLCSLKVFIDNVYSYTITLPKRFNFYDKNKKNIIGIGLNKTGTTSFMESLRREGFKIFNESYGHQYLLQDVHHDNILSTISFLENPLFEVFQDTPFSLTNIYKDIYRFRPNDYYVLTIRNDVEEWVDSAVKMYKDLFLSEKNGKINTNYSNKYVSDNIKVITSNHLYCIYKNWGINKTTKIENQFRDVYNRHLDDVTDFFESKIGSNFIVINVSKENELKRLSNFIGFDSKENNFVWVNKSK